MQNYLLRFALFAFCISFFLSLTILKVQAQENKFVSLQEIRKVLIFRSRIRETDEQLNERLIKEILKRQVSFTLSSEDESALRKIGGSDLLIKTIRKNLVEKLEEQPVLPKKVKEQEALYKIFTDNYNKRDERIKLAIEAGKEFLRRYSDDEGVKGLIDYLTINIPKMENYVKDHIFPDCCFDPINPRGKNYTRFDGSFNAKKWNDLFDVGAEILKNEPEFTDVTITLASVGFDNLANESKRDYLNQTLDYAEKSITLLEKGGNPQTEYYGIYQYRSKTKEFPDGKANALGYMNYIVGYIKYFYLSEKAEAFLYFQKSLKYKSKANEMIRQLNLPSEIKDK